MTVDIGAPRINILGNLMRRIIKKALKDESGQFALITAIAAIPLVICVGVAIDTAYIHNSSTTLQTSLDSAALAAVIPGNMDNAQREAYAKEVFYNNFVENVPVDVKVVATPDRVDIQGSLEKETLFMSFTGNSSVKYQQKAAAIKTNEDVICVMTLSPDARGSLRFEKNALVNAPACSIQVNSNDQNALIASGNYQPNAKRICVHGGVNGNVGPTAQANCSALEDPYAHLSAPNFAGDDSACNYGPLGNLINDALSSLAFAFLSGGLTTETTDGILDAFGTSFAVGEVNEVRYPGVYCDGMHFYDSEVTLMPGTYFIHNGPLTFGAGSIVSGEGVTFVFTGNDSYLYTYDEVELNFTASKTGDYAGLIFFQDRNSSSELTSIIKGNTNIRLVGTTYFPSQDLFVGGLGEMGASSPAMAFIAENITFTSDVDSVIAKNEAEFQEYKTLIEYGADLLNRLGVSDYQVSGTSQTGRASGSLYQDFTTNIQTHLGSQRETGIPFAKSDGGARLISVDRTPL